MIYQKKCCFDYLFKNSVMYKNYVFMKHDTQNSSTWNCVPPVNVLLPGY